MPISKRNRRGLFWLLILSLSIAYSPRVLSSIFSSSTPKISTEEALEIHKEFVVKEVNRVTRKKKKSKFSRPKKKFDPNKYSKQDWMKLGLSDRQTDVVLSFSKRGIRSEEDLKKIFVIPDELYQLLKDSLYFEIQDNHIVENVKEKTILPPINLNSADQNTLISIPGIGSYFAEKIIVYRTKLGGYVSKEQLLEVWGIDNEKYEQIKAFIVIDKGVTQLKINSATIDELKAHPYISYSIANSIVKMREQMEYKFVTDIKRSKLIDEELFSKLEPYLTL